MKLLHLAVGAGLLAALLGGVRAESPAAYERGFQQRANFIIDKKCADDPVVIMEAALQSGLGDPHKYALGPIIARLHRNPQDEVALKAYRMLMEVDKGKGDRGLYHFSVHYRTRLYLMFKDQLPQDVKDSMLYDVTHYFDVMRHGGTENQAYMHRTSGYLWTELLPEPYPGAKETGNQAWLRDWVCGEVKKLYTVGQGEYDSSSYNVFDIAAFSNINDFAQDPNMRAVGRAALDWFATAQAIKNFHGCNVGPEARGCATAAVSTNTDWLSWLWWGDSARPISPDEEPVRVAKHATISLALSPYRPHEIIRNIATKNVPLPFVARGSKPSYWGDRDNKDQEYLYFNTQYAMSTLYSPEDGVAPSGTILPQTTMFKACLLDKDNVRVFGMTNGYHGKLPLEGRTPYDQYHQCRDAALNICYVNKLEDDRTKARSIFGVPLGIMDPVQQDGWYFWQVNKAFIAARPLNGVAAFTELPDKESTDYRWLVSPGTLTGWVVQLGQQPDYRSLADFQRAVREKCKLDLSAFASERTVTFTSLQGDVLKMHHTGGPGGKPDAWSNGEQLVYANWPVFDSPYVHEDANSGILRLTDGRQQLTIDYSGAWPVVRDGVAKGAIVEKSFLSPLIRHK